MHRFLMLDEYVLTSGMKSDVDEYWAGAILWVYDGPAIFRDSDVAGEDDVFEEVTLEDAPTVEDSIWGSVRVDADGRRWVVGDVDPRALSDRQVDYGEQVYERFGVDAPTDENLDTVLYEPVEKDGVFTNETWTLEQCDGSGNPSMSLWDRESRTAVTTFNSDEETSAAVLYFNFGTALSPDWGPSCSATFIDGYGSLLTAAHCVTDDSYSAYPPGKFEVCTRGNYDAASVCYGVNDITVNSDWAGTGVTRAYDFAVIDTTLVVWSQFIAMGTQTDAWLESHGITDLGYPGSTFPSGACNNNDPGTVTNSSFPGSNFLRRDSGDVLNATSTVLRGRFDSGPGDSGGAIVAFSSGVPYHVGVESGHQGGVPTPWSGGPKTSAIRTWVLANTP